MKYLGLVGFGLFLLIALWLSGSSDDSAQAPAAIPSPYDNAISNMAK